tara:strand:+ start:3969 stop:5444 length:1476 start_codon:yes stop_codon:yes gene_type:complete
MNELRSGVNTRLESKNNFDDIKSNFYSNRNSQDQNFIQAINQDNFINFHNYNESLNSTFDDNYSNDYKDYSIEPTLDKNIKKSIKSETSNQDKINFDIDNNIDNYINSNIDNYINKNTKSKINLETENINKSYYKKKDDSNINNNKQKLINILSLVLKKRNILLDSEIIEKYIARYNLSYQNPDPNILLQVVTDFKELSNNNSLKNLKNEQNEKNIIKDEYNHYNEFLISIDSKDRNLNKYKCPNNFKIEFVSNSYNSEKKLITSYDNIISVQLISAIFPKEGLNGISIEDYPYIILEIEELGSNYSSINDNSSKAFAQLTFDLDMGKFKKVVARSESEYKKNFNPNINVNSFTMSIKTPDGKLYNFKTIENNLDCNKDNNEKNIEANFDIFIESDQKNNETLISNENENNNKNIDFNIEYDPNNLDIYYKSEEKEDNTNINNIIKQNENLNENLNENTHIEINDEYPSINFIFKIITQKKKLDNILINNL